MKKKLIDWIDKNGIVDYRIQELHEELIFRYGKWELLEEDLEDEIKRKFNAVVDVYEDDDRKPMYSYTIKA